eukprot:UN20239
MISLTYNTEMIKKFLSYMLKLDFIYGTCNLSC